MHCAGVAGYTWVALLHVWLGLTFKTTLMLANIISISWLYVYHRVLPSPRAEAVSQLHAIGSGASADADHMPQHDAALPDTEAALPGPETYKARVSNIHVYKASCTRKADHNVCRAAVFYISCLTHEQWQQQGSSN